MKIDYVGSINRPRINFSSGRVIDYKGTPFEVTPEEYDTIKDNSDFVIVKEVVKAISPSKAKATKKPKRKTAKKKGV